MSLGDPGHYFIYWKQGFGERKSLYPQASFETSRNAVEQEERSGKPGISDGIENGKQIEFEENRSQNVAIQGYRK